MARDGRQPPGLMIKRHNIRIWCHDCDMAKLQRVVWEGHGSRLLSEVSNQPVVRKFLEAVPYIMNTIRDIHSSVVQNDLEGLMRHAADPVPPVVFSSRDQNNMTAMHKAAGLGHVAIMKYITDRYPQGINDVDKDGRTPLHYAAANRDDQHTYNTLVALGADESILDNKNKTPVYYVNRPQEIDKNILKTVPDAPRTPSSAYPSSWDWKLLNTEVIAELNKKSRRRTKNSSENVSSTNTHSESTQDNRTGGMKQSSTHEFIKNLPGLNVTRLSNDDLQQEPEKSEAAENNETKQPEKEVTANTDEENVPQDEQKEEETVNNNEESEKITENENITQEKVAPEATKESPEIEQDNLEVETEQESDPVQDNGKNGIENAENEVENTSEQIKDNTDPQKDNPPDEEEESLYTMYQDENNHETSEQEPEETEVQTEDKAEAQQPDMSETNPLHTDEIDEVSSTAAEGNNNSINKEDDEDVQVQGDIQSEYSESNLRSTAEASDRGSSKRGNTPSDGRNTQESLIEGLINGDIEQDAQDASALEGETAEGDILVVENEIDPEVSELINSANMEMLAALVLNGEGARLLGRRSGNTELQAFLNNVPSYMKKIHKVHLAAREGNLRDLQAALDRRKFAIARDSVSPNGATPLHVATVFGKTNIIKYLGGRFPETLSAVDFEGRTALHYAAVLPDNGHYYNLLQQLGANAKDLDDNGQAAEEYFSNKNLLPFDQLASDFGVTEDMVQNMLSDRGSSNTINGHMDIPIFRTEEGRYLANTLGDPLIKGLTEVANVKPKDPVAFLASFLNNFPEHEKPRLGTQETETMITKGVAEVENEQPPPSPSERFNVDSNAPPRPIDVITVDPQNAASPDAPEAAFSSINRDEHGQSMLHFAAARTHTKNALFDLLQETDISLAYRDELYRTARDVSIQANVLENTSEIDRWVLQLAARGNTEKLMNLLLEGYDHILDVVDEEGVSVQEVVAQRGKTEMSSFLASIPTFEDSRENLHGAIRRGDLTAVQQMSAGDSGRTLARSKNNFGRTSLHIAVLSQSEDIVEFLAQQFPELLRIGDNLERTPLHYSMGVDNMESLSRVLTRAGAKRVLKDLKGRQPSYYFMNKSDILRLKEEEEIY